MKYCVGLARPVERARGGAHRRVVDAQTGKHSDDDVFSSHIPGFQGLSTKTREGPAEDRIIIEPQTSSASSSSWSGESTVPGREPSESTSASKIRRVNDADRKYKGATSAPTDDPDARSKTGSDAGARYYQDARKAGVAVAGSAMVGIGLIMIPLPVPFGVVVATSGLALLGTEYPEVLEVKDRVEGTLRQNLEAAREAVRAKVVEAHESLVTASGGTFEERRTHPDPLLHAKLYLQHQTAQFLETTVLPLMEGNAEGEATSQDGSEGGCDEGSSTVNTGGVTGTRMSGSYLTLPLTTG